jgi:hypothetical protein
METRTFELEFAKFIERFHEHIIENFLDDAVNKRELMAQHEMGRAMVEELARSICSEFRRNIDRRTSVEEIADQYIRLGIKCAEDGVSYSEMVRVFILLKRHIWVFFQDSNFAGQPFDVRSIVALNNRTTLFFNRAMYYFLVGFEQAQFDDRSELERLYDGLVEKIRRDLSARGQLE